MLPGAQSSGFPETRTQSSPLLIPTLTFAVHWSITFDLSKVTHSFTPPRKTAVTAKAHRYCTIWTLGVSRAQGDQASGQPVLRAEGQAARSRFSSLGRKAAALCPETTWIYWLPAQCVSVPWAEGNRSGHLVAELLQTSGQSVLGQPQAPQQSRPRSCFPCASMIVQCRGRAAL